MKWSTINVPRKVKLDPPGGEYKPTITIVGDFVSQIAVGTNIPVGSGVLSRMVDGEMRVFWAGRLEEFSEWPAGYKLWLNQVDFDQFSVAVG